MEFKQAFKERATVDTTLRTPQRKYVSYSEQSDYITRWQSTSEPLDDFCTQNGISVASFKRWLKQHDARHLKQTHPKTSVTPETEPVRIGPNGLVTTMTVELPGGAMLNLTGELNLACVMELFKEVLTCR